MFVLPKKGIVFLAIFVAKSLLLFSVVVNEPADVTETGEFGKVFFVPIVAGGGVWGGFSVAVGPKFFGGTEEEEEEEDAPLSEEEEEEEEE